MTWHLHCYRYSLELILGFSMLGFSKVAANTGGTNDAFYK